jgi:hypothetical protein
LIAIASPQANGENIGQGFGVSFADKWKASRVIRRLEFHGVRIAVSDGYASTANFIDTGSTFSNPPDEALSVKKDHFLSQIEGPHVIVQASVDAKA